MPLVEIADFLHNRDVDIIADKLRGQKNIILKKKRELEQIERKIDHRLATLAKAQAAKLGEIYLHEEKSKRIVRRYDTLRPRNYLDLEGQIRALEAEQVQTTVFLGKSAWASRGRICSGASLGNMLAFFYCWMRRMILTARWSIRQMGFMRASAFAAATPRRRRSMRD